MKVVEVEDINFDNKQFTVTLTGREAAQIYAALMNLGGDEFNRTVDGCGYKGKKMTDTSELDINSWYTLVKNNL